MIVVMTQSVLEDLQNNSVTRTGGNHRGLVLTKPFETLGLLKWDRLVAGGSTWKIDVGHGEVADVESDDSSGWMKEFILGGELSVDEGADAIPSITVVEDDIEVDTPLMQAGLTSNTAVLLRDEMTTTISLYRDPNVI